MDQIPTYKTDKFGRIVVRTPTAALVANFVLALFMAGVGIWFAHGAIAIHNLALVAPGGAFILVGAILMPVIFQSNRLIITKSELLWRRPFRFTSRIRLADIRSIDVRDIKETTRGGTIKLKVIDLKGEASQILTTLRGGFEIPAEALANLLREQSSKM